MSELRACRQTLVYLFSPLKNKLIISHGGGLWMCFQPFHTKLLGLIKRRNWIKTKRCDEKWRPERSAMHFRERPCGMRSHATGSDVYLVIPRELSQVVL